LIQEHLKVCIALPFIVVGKQPGVLYGGVVLYPLRALVGELFEPVEPFLVCGGSLNPLPGIKEEAGFCWGERDTGIFLSTSIYNFQQKYISLLYRKCVEYY
jgi:hypothetical protein